jgi:4-diphosphocytidyl-2-C-methyl-D-erythritol kinase
MRETAYAKINLALHVRGREPDGYHRIETIFAFAEHGDVLEASPGEGLSLQLRGPFAAALAGEADNLVLRAVRALGIRDTTLILDKRLPVASGIGGGSADAAAALRLLGGGRGDLHKIAASVGADVPACLMSRTVKGTGRGDRLETYDAPHLSGTALLLVNPGVAVSTAEVFKRWIGNDGGPVGELGRNDLLRPALEIAPIIGELLDLLKSTAPKIAGLSGSGATCFALYEDEARRDRASAAISAKQPGWWQLASRLR